MKTQTKSKTDKRDQPSTYTTGVSKEVIIASIIGIVPIMALYLFKLQNEKKSTKE